jgi:hypothetical protein
MKTITMTYIEVLEGMLSRKQAEIKATSAEVAALPDNFNKRKLIELNAEIKTFETCLDLAKVMFDGKKAGRAEKEIGK